MRIIFIVLAFFNTLMLTAQTDFLPARVYNWDSLEPNKEDNRTVRQILEGSTTALSYFEVHATTLEPDDAVHPPNVHADVEELIIIKEGLLRVTINETTQMMGPGSIAFVMPGDEHEIENAGNTAAIYYALNYKAKLPVNIEVSKQSGGSFMLNWNDLPMIKTEKGGRREFFNEPTSQLAKFEMHTTMLNAGQVSHDPHTHIEEEIVLIIRGNARMQIGENFYEAAAGDLVFLASGVSHALKNTGDGQCEYFAFQWR